MARLNALRIAGALLAGALLALLAAACSGSGEEAPGHGTGAGEVSGVSATVYASPT